MTGKRERQSLAFEIADSHAHLDMVEFNPDREAVLERAWTGGIRFVLCPAELTTPESWTACLSLSRSYPWVQLAAGVHPHRAHLLALEHLNKMEELARQGLIRAIGEIGLDYHYHFSPPSAQRQAFSQQLALAQQLALPVIIHSRLAGKDILSAVEKERFQRRGVLHCFTENWELARGMMDRGFFISFSGILTYPTAGDLREIARKTPLDRLLLETDCPYLVPEPLRGTTKRNEPQFLVHTARRLAEIKKKTLEEIGQAALTNCRALFLI